MIMECENDIFIVIIESRKSIIIMILLMFLKIMFDIRQP